MKQHGAFATIRVLRAVVAVLCLVIGGSVDSQRAVASGGGCSHGRLALSSWRIPDSRPSAGAWWPLAVYGSRVVMVHQRSYESTQPEQIAMALAVVGSPRFRAILPSAYPHFGVLQRWQLSWPWLVGVVDTLALPGPVDWRLWAGNLLTGRHVVIDQGNNRSAGTSGRMRGFPDFDVEGGQVVWTRTAYSLRRGVPPAEHVALDDLASRRTIVLPVPVPSSQERYANPTLSGSRVVWERYTTFACTDQHCPNYLIDLQMYDLVSHRLTTLSHGSFRLGSSFSPGLWKNELLFLHGYGPESGGRVVEVDLSHRVAGAHAFWWQGYVHRSMGRGNASDLTVRDGLAMWDGGLADLSGGGSMTLALGSEQIMGGHALVLESKPLQPYALSRVLHRCAASA